MENTFSNKVNILADFYVEAGEPSDNTGDLAKFLFDFYPFLIISLYISTGVIIIDEPTDKLSEYIDNSYRALCDLYVLDYDETYNGSLDEFLSTANVSSYDGMGLNG